MKVIKNMLLEIVTLILMVINLYMFFIQSGIARIQQTTQEEFDAFWRTLSIMSLIFLVIVVVVYIVSVKVFKRTIGKTLLGGIILLGVNVIILALTNATTVLIFVAAILYIIYLLQMILNIRKNN
jgi:O-antigen ligase